MTTTEQLNLIKPEPEKASEKNEDDVEIVDSDLLEQIKGLAEGSKLYRMMESRLKRTQAERNEIANRRAAMTPIERRRDITKQEISDTKLEREDIHHIHSVLALCGLPYRRQEAQKLDEQRLDYIKHYGSSSVIVQSGYLKHPKTGEVIKQGLPYGPKARLLLLYICTAALRQQSPEIEIEESLTGFVRSFGTFESFNSNTGRKTIPTRTLNAFKEQLNRLVACNVTLGLWDRQGEAVTVKTNPVKRAHLWFPQDPDQQMLWPSKVVLSDDFYNSLTKHALPVDIRFLSAFTHSAKQMDILLWLAFRLKQLKGDYLIHWNILKEQFCQSDKTRMTEFKRDFAKDIKAIQQTLERDDFPFRLIDDKGLLLKPVNPQEYFVPPKKLSKRALKA